MGRLRLTAILVFAVLTVLISWGLIGQARKIASVMENRTDRVNSILDEARGK